MSKLDKFAKRVFIGAQADKEVQGNFMIGFGPILMEAFQKLMDCLFDRFGGGGSELQPAEKAVKIKKYVDTAGSQNPRHQAKWGSYKPSKVRAASISIRKAAKKRGEKLTGSEAREQAISLFDEVEVSTEKEVEELVIEQAAL